MSPTIDGDVVNPDVAASPVELASTVDQVASSAVVNPSGGDQKITSLNNFATVNSSTSTNAYSPETQAQPLNISSRRLRINQVIELFVFCKGATFGANDFDFNPSITEGELLSCLNVRLSKNPKLLEAIKNTIDESFSKIDANKDGLATFTEFVNAINFWQANHQIDLRQGMQALRSAVVR